VVVGLGERVRRLRTQGFFIGSGLLLVLALALAAVGYLVFVLSDGSLPRSVALADLINKTVTAVAIVWRPVGHYSRMSSSNQLVSA
jgi:hypothetical protein